MTHNTKLRREAEHLTLKDRAVMKTPSVPNARISSPSGKQTYTVDATPEALAVWQRYGWTVRWLRNGE